MGTTYAGNSAGVRLAVIETMARTLMAAHGLAGWTFAWDRSKRRAGCCMYGKTTLSFSRPLMELWTVKQARKTILHEIAHALTPGDGHGKKWAMKCRELGIEPDRCWGNDNEARVASKYTGTCPAGHEIHRDRKTAKMDRISCGKCSPLYSAANKYTWREN